MLHVPKAALKYNITDHVLMLSHPKKVHPPDGRARGVGTERRRRQLSGRSETLVRWAWLVCRLVSQMVEAVVDVWRRWAS